MERSWRTCPTWRSCVYQMQQVRVSPQTEEPRKKRCPLPRRASTVMRHRARWSPALGANHQRSTPSMRKGPRSELRGRARTYSQVTQAVQLNTHLERVTERRGNTPCSTQISQVILTQSSSAVQQDRYSRRLKQTVKHDITVVYLICVTSSLADLGGEHPSWSTRERRIWMWPANTHFGSRDAACRATSSQGWHTWDQAARWRRRLWTDERHGGCGYGGRDVPRCNGVGAVGPERSWTGSSRGPEVQHTSHRKFVIHGCATKICAVISTLLAHPQFLLVKFDSRPAEGEAMRESTLMEKERAREPVSEMERERTMQNLVDMQRKVEQRQQRERERQLLRVRERCRSFNPLLFGSLFVWHVTRTRFAPQVQERLSIIQNRKAEEDLLGVKHTDRLKHLTQDLPQVNAVQRGSPPSRIRHRITIFCVLGG